MPVNLKSQLRELAARHVGSDLAEIGMENMSTLLCTLGALAFYEKWPEGNDTVLLRTALAVCASGPLSDNEPGIFFTNDLPST